MTFKDNSSDWKLIIKASHEAPASPNLDSVDPLLRNIVEITNPSNWLRTEFSCFGLPDDQTSDSEGLPRRWGSYTRGEMYIAYFCPWRQMNQVLEQLSVRRPCSSLR